MEHTGFTGNGLQNLIHQNFRHNAFPHIPGLLHMGREWVGKKIIFLTDNEAITFVWQRQTSKCRKLMNLVRKISFNAAKYDFTISLKHISGHYNILADVLSRLQVHKFLDLHPMADKDPTLVLQDAWRI